MKNYRTNKKEETSSYMTQKVRRMDEIMASITEDRFCDLGVGNFIFEYNEDVLKNNGVIVHFFMETPQVEFLDLGLISKNIKEYDDFKAYVVNGRLRISHLAIIEFRMSKIAEIEKQQEQQ